MEGIGCNDFVKELEDKKQASMFLYSHYVILLRSLDDDNAVVGAIYRYGLSSIGLKDWYC